MRRLKLSQSALLKGSSLSAGCPSASSFFRTQHHRGVMVFHGAFFIAKIKPGKGFIMFIALKDWKQGKANAMIAAELHFGSRKQLAKRAIEELAQELLATEEAIRQYGPDANVFSMPPGGHGCDLADRVGGSNVADSKTQETKQGITSARTND